MRVCPHGSDQRAQIVLPSADRPPVLEIPKRVGVGRPMVWRWQQRYAEHGRDGLLRDNASSTSRTSTVRGQTDLPDPDGTKTKTDYGHERGQSAVKVRPNDAEPSLDP